MKTSKLKTIPKKNPVGSPSKYNSLFHPGWAKSLAMLGLIDEQICKVMEVSQATYINWKKIHPEFLKAVKEGKDNQDQIVENALLQRAKGYEYDEITERPVVIKCNNKPKKVMAVSEIKHKRMAPEVVAQIFWLKNRRPDRWRDRQDIEHSGTIGYKVIPDDLSEIIEEETKE